MDLVPPDDSVECSGQFESRGSVTGSEEPTISESMLQCVSETVLCALNVFLYMHVYMWVDHLCAVSESMLQCVWGWILCVQCTCGFFFVHTCICVDGCTVGVLGCYVSCLKDLCVNTHVHKEYCINDLPLLIQMSRPSWN